MAERTHAKVANFDIYEPATDGEMGYVLAHAKYEPNDQPEQRMAGREDQLTAFLRARTKASVYHRGELICIAGVSDFEFGRLISVNRTTHGYAWRHRYAWLRNLPELTDWLRRADDAKGGRGRFYTVSPKEYGRAWLIFGKCGGFQVGETAVNGRPYWIFDMTGKVG